MADMPMAEDVIHVLVVDDEAPKLQQSIGRFRGASNQGTTVVANGVHFHVRYETEIDSALNILTYSEHPVNVVLLDRYFENEVTRDGLWLLTQIGHMSVDIPVAIFTQFADFDSAHRAGLLRADRFFSKPYFFDASDPDAEGVRELFENLDHLVHSKMLHPELHDRQHLDLADSYADEGYDEGEQAFPATVAYYVFENQRILEEVRSLLDRSDQVRICDIGCGTGRIEELLARELGDVADRMSITAVDFSGRMLRRMRNKREVQALPKLAIQRGSAEALTMLEDRSFDLVIMGFGVPSYTRYHLSLREASRICREDGVGLFSVYNEKSAIYEARERSQWSREDRPIAAIADPATGKLNVGGKREFDCEVFEVSYFERLLGRFGFSPRRTETFPTLHAMLPRSMVARFGDAREPLDGFPHSTLFSFTLYDLDQQVSSASPNRGHYILVKAQRVAD